MRGVSKSFGNLRALDEVSLSVEEGCTHALVGENGAGKTTLMRILYGAVRPDEGKVSVAGRVARFSRSADAIAAGIGMVSQHYSVIPDLTCLDNLMLGAEPGLFITRAAAIRRADELAARMGFTFEWSAPASLLTPAGAQKLEILKLLWREARIMILDEPTAMLSPADADSLFASLRRLTEEGATVILVTHRLPEVMEHCSHVTVLRSGRLVADLSVSEASPTKLAELIIGRQPAPPTRFEHAPSHGKLLEVRGLVVRDSRKHTALQGIDFSVSEGEVLGIAGVDGSGQRELIHALAGLAHPEEGATLFEGADITDCSARSRLGMGIRVIPEDRHEEGLIEGWSLIENAALGGQRMPPFARGALVNIEGRLHAAETIANRFETRHSGLDKPASSLSGGNQQRFVAGRALYQGARLILAFQPARGLDIDATRRLYDGIHAECSTGAAAIVVSFDLDELLENCDRVVAMNLGRMYEPPPGQEKDRGAIGRLMVGAGS